MQCLAERNSVCGFFSGALLVFVDVLKIFLMVFDWFYACFGRFFGDQLALVAAFGLFSLVIS